VEWLPEPQPEHTEQLTRLTEKTLQDFSAYRTALSGEFDSDFPLFEDFPADPTVVSFLLTAAILLPTAERQELLAAQDTPSRLTLIRALLRRETGLITHLGALPAVDLFHRNASLN
jgi:hypothetical protein